MAAASSTSTLSLPRSREATPLSRKGAAAATLVITRQIRGRKGRMTKKRISGSTPPAGGSSGKRSEILSGVSGAGASSRTASRRKAERRLSRSA